MIFSLLLTSLFIPIFIPIFVTVIILYVSNRLLHIKPSLSSILFIAWLPLYIWIMQYPHILPKQALDWVWVYMLISSIYVNNKTNDNSRIHATVIYQSIVFILIGYLMLRPTISHNASIESHWYIWLENLISGLLSTYILIKLSIDKYTQENNRLLLHVNMHLWLITGAIGLTVFLTGSLLIGELLFALSSTFLILGFYCRLQSNVPIKVIKNSLPALYGLILLMLLISRTYVEINIINMTLLIISITLSSVIISKNIKNTFILLLFLGCLFISTGYSIYTEIINPLNNGYY